MFLKRICLICVTPHDPKVKFLMNPQNLFNTLIFSLREQIMKKIKLQKIIAAGVFAASAAFSISAMAWTVDVNNKLVTALGVHVPSLGYVGIDGGIDPKCSPGLLYFDISTALGKAMQTTLLTAKAMGRNVRVGYTPGATAGRCDLELVEIQNPSSGAP
jgi:hypothetical protein